MWGNETADEIMNLHNRAIPELGIHPRNPHRIALYDSCVKKSIKSAFVQDEDSFWGGITENHNSVSGHIRAFFALNRKKIKNIYKLLNVSKIAQSTFSQFLSATLFKEVKNGIIFIPPCNLCNEPLGTWGHFISCRKLCDVPGAFLRSPEGVVEVINAYIERRDIICPDDWVPENLLIP